MQKREWLPKTTTVRCAYLLVDATGFLGKTQNFILRNAVNANRAYMQNTLTTRASFLLRAPLERSLNVRHPNARTCSCIVHCRPEYSPCDSRHECAHKNNRSQLRCGYLPLTKNDVSGFLRDGQRYGLQRFI